MSGSRFPGLAGLTSGLLILAGCFALLQAATDQRPAPPTVDRRSASATPSRAETPPLVVREARRVRAATARAAVADRLRGPVLPQSEPLRVRVPRLDVTSSLTPLGLDQFGAMQVPPDGQHAGWYTGAPTPGAVGPAVIAGHVTWDRVPAIFYRLGELRRSDRIQVLREDGRLAVFAVQRVARFAKSTFPSREVYGPTDHAALRLITCGGQYDEVQNRYVDNVVVFATMVAVRQG